MLWLKGLTLAVLKRNRINRWKMSRPKTLPVPRTFDSGSFRWTGLLLIGVAMLSACDLDYPTTTWTDPDYDHSALSDGFDLTGPHEGSACTSCHAPPNYDLIYDPADNQDCVACHEEDYEAQHGSDGYPTTCLTCHNGEVWERGPLDHEVESGGFDLTGPHEDAGCEACHAPSDFEVIFEPANDEDCVACHEAEYQAQHASDGYPTTCLSCHDGEVWERGPFDHEVESGGFELWGTHTVLNCESCHVPETFEPRWDPVDDQDCAACHG
jgi:hypothetical protein